MFNPLSTHFTLPAITAGPSTEWGLSVQWGMVDVSLLSNLLQRQGEGGEERAEITGRTKPSVLRTGLQRPPRAGGGLIEAIGWQGCQRYGERLTVTPFQTRLSSAAG